MSFVLDNVAVTHEAMDTNENRQVQREYIPFPQFQNGCYGGYFTDLKLDKLVTPSDDRRLMFVHNELIKSKLRHECCNLGNSDL